jgi:hypothetical protein
MFFMKLPSYIVLFSWVIHHVYFLWNFLHIYIYIYVHNEISSGNYLWNNIWGIRIGFPYKAHYIGPGVSTRTNQENIFSCCYIPFVLIVHPLIRDLGASLWTDHMSFTIGSDCVSHQTSHKSPSLTVRLP